MDHERTSTQDRRRFLAFGGAAVAMGAIVAACSSGGSDDIPVTGTLPAPPADPTVETSQRNDVTMLRTAQSVEALAAETYREVLASGQITSGSTREAAQSFADAHQQRVGMVGQLVTSAGGTPFTQPNPYLDETVVQPALEAVTTPEEALALLVAVEKLTSQTEVFAAESLTTAQLRSGIVALGSSSARSVSVLSALQGQPPVAFAMFPLGARAPEKAQLPE